MEKCLIENALVGDFKGVSFVDKKHNSVLGDYHTEIEELAKKYSNKDTDSLLEDIKNLTNFDLVGNYIPRRYYVDAEATIIEIDFESKTYGDQTLYLEYETYPYSAFVLQIE